jgi:hypothetical protein
MKLFTDATVSGLLSICFGCMLSQTVLAQTGTNRDRIEVAGTYQAVLQHNMVEKPYLVTSAETRSWLPGGAALEVAGQLPHGWAIVGRAYGGRATNNNSGGNGFNLESFGFGPRYRFAPAHSRHLQLFTDVLFGEAGGWNGNFGPVTYPTPRSGPQYTSSAHSFGMTAGGGVDLTIARHVAFHLLQVNYLLTAFPNSMASPQQNLQLGTGVVLRFGKR